MRFRRLLQSRLIEGFENYDLAHAPLRNADLGQAEHQMLIDVRRFRIDVESEPAAQIGLSVKLVDKNGTVVASRLFEENEKARQSRSAWRRWPPSMRHSAEWQKDIIA